MFRREVNVPPRMLFIVSMAISCGLDLGGANSPAKIIDWMEPGRSIRYTNGLGGFSTCPMVFFGTVPSGHLRKSFSSFGVISARVVSPTTINVALLGLNQV